MKRYFMAALAATMGFSAIHAQDIIILRDGNETTVRVLQVNEKQAIYTEKGSKDAQQKAMPNDLIYMIKYEKRGNVFFTEDGERLSTGIGMKPDRQATLVYMTAGQEIEAYDMVMDAKTLTFRQGKGKKAIVSTVPKTQVFMIKYPDGTKDVLNSLVKIKVEEPPVVAPPVAEEEPSPYPMQADIITKAGRTIKGIVIAEDENTVAFQRQTDTDGPVYFISQKRLKSINPTETNK